ncbi:hypothetical protein AALA22_15920 [Anaerovoracaceae bacterium 41-7]
MTTEKMNVHKALCEMKTLDNRILSKIRGFEPCTANRKSNKKINGISIEDFKKNVAEEYQSITDLINRRYAIKKAITNSNAITKVIIGSEEFTVAEAIEMKNSGMSLLETLYDRISMKYSVAQSKCNNENEELAEKAANHVANTYNGGEKNIKDADTARREQDFIENNTFSIVQGIRCDEEIKKLEEKISTFNVEVDSALSVSNAITEITIEY